MIELKLFSQRNNSNRMWTILQRKKQKRLKVNDLLQDLKAEINKVNFQMNESLKVIKINKGKVNNQISGVKSIKTLTCLVSNRMKRTH